MVRKLSVPVAFVKIVTLLAVSDLVAWWLQHPITRFHARYIMDSPQKLYERHLHFLNKQQEQIMIKYVYVYIVL